MGLLNWITGKIIGSKNARELKKLSPVVEEINNKEIEYQEFSDEQLKNLTKEFKLRYQQGESLDDLKVEAFAAVKNVCRRLCGQSWKVCGHEIEWNMVPYDVQLIGGLALHEGKIAEMATGEGKTLVASLPLYLNALSGQNVQLVTVNEYLAKRDSEWMGKIYEFLGLSVGALSNNMHHDEKREIYQKDIIYATASELGFDYLRDNGMAMSAAQQVQRSHFYCIIDEVDSILIDEARTPLIISGAVDVSTHRYDKLKPRISKLVREQQELCSKNIMQAEKVLKDDPKNDEGSLLLYKVSIGQPKNRRFLKLMESPKFKRILEKTETFMNTDLKKEENAALKEELFYVIDEKNNQVHLTEKGRDSISYDDDPDEFVIPDLVAFSQELDDDQGLNDSEKQEKREVFQRCYEEKMEKIHNISQLLKAFSLFEKDIEYVVQENKVIIVDENTGRLQPGRRFSDGLHQALEAKEGVKIEKETQTLATITIQNYFRMYDKMSGMTGTAETEANEFYQIYKMEVLVIPTNVPIQRDDRNDIIYKTKREKYNAIINDVEKTYREGRPVLVGTASVDVSEVLSRLMKRRKIPHNVLNAKNHQREAEIVADAGLKGKVTIATNMAGRGTDIKLSQEVKDLGGLHIVGSERHESRRIDRQLRGRAGRQGDPGSSVFYISLEDDLMRLFGSDTIANVMERMGIQDGEELESPLLTRAIERAQKKVEERNFGIRKHTLEFDDIMNKQRDVLYKTRNKILTEDNLKPFVQDRVASVVENGVLDRTYEENWNHETIEEWFRDTWPMTPPLNDLTSFTNPDDIITYLTNTVNKIYDHKEGFEGEDNIRKMERFVCLDVTDRLWKEHLKIMDDVRESSYLQAYGQRNPLQEYKKSAFEAFADFMERVDRQIASEIFRVTSVNPHELANVSENDLNMLHEILDGYAAQKNQDVSTNVTDNSAKKTPFKKSENIGRNDPCPCGSGKKYKKCCGAS